MGGVCNCCLDEKNKAYLLENECVDFTVKCLSRFAFNYKYGGIILCMYISLRSSNEETVLSAITTLLYLTTPESKKGEFCHQLYMGWH